LSGVETDPMSSESKELLVLLLWEGGV
jgi:hypothetical protein